MATKNSISRRIVKIYRSSLIDIIPQLEKFHIGKGQWYYLNRLLFEGDGISQEELSRDLVVDKAHTARAIKILEEKDLVYCKIDPKDRRKKNVFVTEKALEIKDEYYKIFEDLNKKLTKDFTDEERKQLKDFLYRIENNITQFVNNN